MRKVLISAMTLVLGLASASAQSLEDLNVQIHGYATQGFLYTTQNNMFTTSSSDGSPAWTEAVANVSVQPIPKLRIGIQTRYYILGNYGNAITLDWAAADFRANDRFGARFGKVKIPSGLFNETQDIDPSYIWALLPQSSYPIGSRNSTLALYGGVTYGTLGLGHKLGKLEYRAWGGEEKLGSDDGNFVNQRESGLLLTNGLGGVVFGSALHWKTPLTGLMIGASDYRTSNWSAPVTGYGMQGTERLKASYIPSYFARYDKGRVMLAGEYGRAAGTFGLQFNGLPNSATPFDIRSWYLMSSYKVSDKFSAGIYHSQQFSRKAVLGPARFQKDWAISARYDFNQFLYAKAEQHFIDGTAVGYDTALNPNGLKPDTKLTILKVGVSF